MGEKISKRLETYLKWANFNYERENPRYYKRLWFDFFAAMLYYSISVALIWLQKADVFVLGLNILCMLRALLRNTLNASEVADLRNIDTKCEGGSHYHIKAIIMCVASVMIALVWFIIVVEQLQQVNSSIIRILASIANLLVFLNDCDELVIYAYDAVIE